MVSMIIVSDDQYDDDSLAYPPELDYKHSIETEASLTTIMDNDNYNIYWWWWLHVIRIIVSMITKWSPVIIIIIILIIITIIIMIIIIIWSTYLSSWQYNTLLSTFRWRTSWPQPSCCCTHTYCRRMSVVTMMKTTVGIYVCLDGWRRMSVVYMMITTNWKVLYVWVEQSVYECMLKISFFFLYDVKCLQ